MAPPATRLDAVVRLKERDEERTRLELVRTAEATRRAKAAAEEALARTRQDSRKKDSAAVWEMHEAAHASALREAKLAADRANESRKHEDAAREKHQVARRNAEALRRVVETKREEIVQDQRRQERRESDEIASLLFGR